MKVFHAAKTWMDYHRSHSKSKKTPLTFIFSVEYYGEKESQKPIRDRY
jgi:hypothetical protein